MKRIDHVTSLFQRSRPFFSALGDPVRQTLLLTMLQGELLSVKELTQRTNLSRPTVSHHLKILKQAGIIVEQKKGRQIFYCPQPGEYFYIAKELLETIDKELKNKGKQTQ